MHRNWVAMGVAVAAATVGDAKLRSQHAQKLYHDNKQQTNMLNNTSDIVRLLISACVL